MALKVIGAGFGRTGTLSLKLALEQLGFSKCHHMQEVMASGSQANFWYSISQGRDVDWDEVFEGFAASVDWPACTYWEPLYRRYPDSKVILTIRDPDRWYDSVLETIYPMTTEIPKWLVWMVPRFRKVVDLVNTNIWNGTFDGRVEDRAHAIEVFHRNTERVKKGVPPERLLVFQATDGWEPLCEFLGVPIPDGPYPHANEAAEMKRMILVMRVIRWLPHALAVWIVLWLVF